jgi:Uma2 family endonuclease
MTYHNPVQQSQRHYTVDDYFLAEESSPLRHEYFRGEIFVMAGGTPEHNTIALNVAAAFHGALTGSPCRAFGSDQRIATPSGLYTYPDVSVACGPLRLTNERLPSILNPVVLVEVLSDSTRDYDRGEKFDLYASIPTLHDYLLVEPARVYLEHRSRSANGEWTSVVKESIDDSVSLTSVSIVMPLALVYENIVISG